LHAEHTSSQQVEHVEFDWPEDDVDDVDDVTAYVEDAAEMPADAVDDVPEASKDEIEGEQECELWDTVLSCFVFKPGITMLRPTGELEVRESTSGITGLWPDCAAVPDC
jgi:hypothetical protein